MKTIYILWLRQLKRFIRSKSRVIGALGQPILFLFALGFGLGPVFEKAGSGDYIQFLAPGIITMTILFAGIFSAIDIIWEKQFGFLKATLVAPVRRSHIIIGKTLGGATVALIQGIIIFAITFIAGFRPDNYWLIPVAIFYMILVAVLFTAVGGAIASRMNDMQGFPLILNFIIMPIFFLSGALFPLQGLSKVLVVITSLNPLSYGVDAIRGTLTGTVHFGLGLDLAVLVILTVVAIAVGAYQFSKVEA